MNQAICNTTFTKDDFFRFLKESVIFGPKPKGKPKDTVCRRLQSFVMPTKKSNLKLENFGVNIMKAYNKDYYFQHKGPNKFPALILSEVAGWQENKQGAKKHCCKFEIGVLDLLIENCGNNCGYCGKRMEQDVIKDAKMLLDQSCLYLETIVSARPFKYEKNAAGIVTGKTYTTDKYDWVSKAVINHLISEGKIDGVDEHYVTTSKFLKSLNTNNARQNVRQWQYPKNYHGIWTEIIICTNLSCEQPDWNVHEHKDKINVQCC